MSKLLINEPPLQVLPSLAVAIGLNEAIFLQQLHYWLTPSAKYKPHYREYEGVTRPWIYNTYHNKNTKEGDETGWQANFPFWSVSTIKRIAASLNDKDLIITTDQFNDHYTNRTLWYTIDYENLTTYETIPESVNLTPSESVNLTPSESVNLTPSRQRLPKTTTENMPLRAEDEFSDLLGNDQPQPNGSSNGKPKMTEAVKAHMLTFGILPGQDIDPAEYALQQEIMATGWDIYSDDVKQGIIYFTLAVRDVVPEFALPMDTSTRKLWRKEVGGHLKNYSLVQLKDLYKRAIIKMREKDLSFWQPGSLTKWALPEVVNTPSSSPNGTASTLSAAEKQRYDELVAENS